MYSNTIANNTKKNNFNVHYFLGVSLRVGLYRASLRFGASTSLTAALTIPNALRHSTNETQGFCLQFPTIPHNIAHITTFFAPTTAKKVVFCIFKHRIACFILKNHIFAQIKTLKKTL